MKTRDGRCVRIFCTDGGGSRPIMGAWLNGAGVWVHARWTEKGKGGNRELDIVDPGFSEIVALTNDFLAYEPEPA